MTLFVFVFYIKNIHDLFNTEIIEFKIKRFNLTLKITILASLLEEP